MTERINSHRYKDRIGGKGQKTTTRKLNTPDAEKWIAGLSETDIRRLVVLIDYQYYRTNFGASFGSEKMIAKVITKQGTIRGLPNRRQMLGTLHEEK